MNLKDSDKNSLSCLTDSPKIHPILRKHFGYCLNKAAIRLRSKMNEALGDHGLVIAQAGILSVLNESGGLNQLSLGEELDIDKATMVKLLDGLEELKLVERSVDPSDRRNKLVEITSKGRNELSDIRADARKVEEEFLSALSSDERNQLRQLISKLLIG